MGWEPTRYLRAVKAVRGARKFRAVKSGVCFWRRSELTMGTKAVRAVRAVRTFRAVRSGVYI